jgi:hypothetical protein
VSFKDGLGDTIGDALTAKTLPSQTSFDSILGKQNGKTKTTRQKWLLWEGELRGEGFIYTSEGLGCCKDHLEEGS